MAIIGISSGIRGFGVGGFGSKTGQMYMEQINDQYTRVKVTKGSFVPSTASSAGRPNIIAAVEFLNAAAEKPELAASFEKKLPKIEEANKLFATINRTGRKLAAQAYTVDRNGKLVCHGKDLAADKNFSIDLGNVSDKVTNYTDKIYNHFELSASEILFASYKPKN